jgi:hypothetical protein
MTDRVLTDEQIEFFLENGYVTVQGCFSREAAKPFIDEAWERLGVDRNDPETWVEKRVHLPNTKEFEVKDFAPKAWRAACELVGGEERIDQPYLWTNSFVINLGIGADREWEPASHETEGWHKDGDWFRHFLDSPEQGLLTIVVWSDIEPFGGGTFIAADSVAPVARLLVDKPEGVHPEDLDFDALIRQCDKFVEATGKVGDVVLIHPYVLHSQSQNHSGRGRFITNPPITLKEPMQFDRDDPSEYSVIERAVLRALDADRLDFKPTAPRERVVPERELVFQRMLAEEQARLAEAGAQS